MLGHVRAFAADPDAFVARWRRELGDVYRVKLLGVERTFVCDPFDVPRVLSEKRLAFHEVSADVGGRVFGYDVHRAAMHDMCPISTLLARNMRGHELQAISERMQVLFVRRIVEHIGRTGTRVSLLKLLKEHFFAAGLEALFGHPMYTPELFGAYARVDRFFPLAALGVPAWLLPGFVRAANALAQSCRAKLPGRARALESLDEFCLERGLDQEEAARYDVGVLWASQANTVAAAFWTVRFILGSSEARKAIGEEVQALADPSASPSDVRPFPKDALRRMVLLDSATSEAMRLTNGSMVVRRATEDFVLDLDSGRRVALREGDEIIVYARSLEIDPEIFPHPYTFQYQRFVDERGRPARFFLRGRRIATPTLPFGGGASMCPGRHFARNEIKILVATLLLWLDAELGCMKLPDLDFSRMGFGILPPRTDVDLLVKLR